MNQHAENERRRQSKTCRHRTTSVWNADWWGGAEGVGSRFRPTTIQWPDAMAENDSRPRCRGVPKWRNYSEGRRIGAGRFLLAYRNHKPDAPARDRHPFAKRQFPSL